MDDKKKSKILQKNGEIVFDALRSMDDSKTLTDIVNYVAATNHTQPEKIKGSVKQVLDTAVQYGFIKRIGYKYSIKPIDGAAASTSESENEDAQPEDSGRKRRRSRSRSGGKGRSRSRRRRRM